MAKEHATLKVTRVYSGFVSEASELGHMEMSHEPFPTKIKMRHAYSNWAHAVSPSPWPMFVGVSILASALGFVVWMHFHFAWLMVWGLLNIVMFMTLWWRDVISEATFQGEHTWRVMQSFKLGFTMFMVSEMFFFAGFFWAYFYCSLNPSMHIGCYWPPMGMEVMNPWGLPLWNTVILLTSGATVTWSHHALAGGELTESLKALNVTMLLALLFTYIQYMEYYNAPFTMACGIYGSCFFMMTGFHGIHVMVGTMFLAVNYYSMKQNHFTVNSHLSFEFAIMYWHFVDVIWILVWFFLYAPLAY